MPKKNRLDAIDLQIISVLRKNADITNKDLAAKVGLSEAPTLVRVGKLKSSRIIQSVKAQIDYKKLGYRYTTGYLITLVTVNTDLMYAIINKRNNVLRFTEHSTNHMSTFKTYYVEVFESALGAFANQLLHNKQFFELQYNIQMFEVKNLSV